MNRRTALFLCLVLAAGPLDAFTRKFRLYDLANGQKINAAFKFKWSSMSGQVVATGPGGHKMEGEFNTGHTGAAAWGSIYNSRGAYANSSAVAITGTRGSLILTGDEGLVIKCEYVTNFTTTHGNGACQDNRGGQYTLMF